jgi:hypothetical protein
LVEHNQPIQKAVSIFVKKAKRVVWVSHAGQERPMHRPITGEIIGPLHRFIRSLGHFFIDKR